MTHFPTNCLRSKSVFLLVLSELNDNSLSHQPLNRKVIQPPAGVIVLCRVTHGGVTDSGVTHSGVTQSGVTHSCVAHGGVTHGGVTHLLMLPHEVLDVSVLTLLGLMDLLLAPQLSVIPQCLQTIIGFTTP